MKHTAFISFTSIIIIAACVMFWACDDSIFGGKDTDYSAFTFTFTPVSLTEGEASAGMKAGGFETGSAVTLAEDEYGEPVLDNGKFEISGKELLVTAELSGGPHYVTFSVAGTNGAGFTRAAIIFVAFAGGPSELNFTQDYRLMTGTAAARGLAPVGTFEPKGGIGPFSYSLIQGPGETGKNNGDFRGGDGIYAVSALETGEYSIYVRCTGTNGMFIDKAVTVTVTDYASPAFTDDKDYVTFPETIVNGDLEYESAIFLDGRDLTIPAFMLAKYEVTKKIWWDVHQWAVSEERNGNKYTFVTQSPVLPSSAPASGDEGKPQTDVSWLNAALWLNAFSEKQGLAPVYYTDADFTQLMRSFDIATEKKNNDFTVYKNNAVYAKWQNNGFRLPCEAEWELAARGGVPSSDPDSPWMYRFAGTNDYVELSTRYARTTLMATGAGNQAPDYQKPQAAGLMLPNTAGLYDMTGNANEWADDIFVFTYPQMNGSVPLRGPEPKFTGNDAAYNYKGTFRGARGGSVKNAIGYLGMQPNGQGILNRSGGMGISANLTSGNSFEIIGFRIARTVAGN
ncbi:MAG: SUMF1/EgtB/PvdO family nonheme iron enzyme [Treponema sp.]|jgi:formylglycine-generating enzyme required for sulfatase activity|nr:SUMF1/EgtB/PvdO family nonheme iron enzyme [Treponema sp.]